MRNYIKVIVLLSVLIFCFERDTIAQSIDYSVHANIIYHFTKYIDWPDNRKSGDFIIGVVGESPLLDELKKATLNKTIGNQRIIIKYFSSSDSFFSCNILFVSEDESDQLKKIILLTQHIPVLIITEEEGLAKKGSCINFIIVDDRTKLEFNVNNIDKRNLKIASELLSLGTVIK